MRAKKEHFLKVLAAVLIATCLVLIAMTHLTPRNEAVSLGDIDFALGLVEESCRENPAAPYALPDYAGTVNCNMQRTDELLVDETSVSWSFYPRPEMTSVRTGRATVLTVRAVLPSPCLSAGVCANGKPALTLNPGTGEKHCAGRTLLVWRKPASESDWPSHPWAVLRTAPGERPRFEPADIATVAEGGGFKLRLQPPPLRQA